MNDTRGEQRFAAVTYSKLVEWTGLKLNTVRHYATRGAFDRWNLESVLTWVNGRRAALGLPLIGLPNCTTGEVLPMIQTTKGGPEGIDIVWTTDPEFLRKMGGEVASSAHPETEHSTEAASPEQATAGESEHDQPQAQNAGSGG